LERNKKKQETVKKYAAIRAELKAKRKITAGLTKLPKKRQPRPGREPLRHQRPPSRYLRKFNCSRMTFREAAC